MLSKVYLERILEEGSKTFSNPPPKVEVTTMVNLLFRDLSIMYSNLVEWSIEYNHYYGFSMDHKTSVNVFDFVPLLDHICKEKRMPSFSITINELGYPEIEPEISIPKNLELGIGREETYLRRLNGTDLKLFHIPTNDINTFVKALKKSVWAWEDKLENVSIEFLKNSDGVVMRHFVVITLFPKRDFKKTLIDPPAIRNLPHLAIPPQPYFLMIKRTTGEYKHINLKDLQFEVNRLTMHFIYDMLSNSGMFDTRIYHHNKVRIDSVCSIINTMSKTTNYPITFRMVRTREWRLNRNIYPMVVNYPDMILTTDEFLTHGVCVDVNEIHTTIMQSLDRHPYDIFELSPWGEHFIMTGSQRNE